MNHSDFDLTLTWQQTLPPRVTLDIIYYCTLKVIYIYIASQGLHFICLTDGLRNGYTVYKILLKITRDANQNKMYNLTTGSGHILVAQMCACVVSFCTINGGVYVCCSSVVAAA